MRSYIQQCPLNYLIRNTCTRTCILLKCELSHCLVQVVHTGYSLTSFFFDDVWTSNALASVAGITVTFYKNTYNTRSRKTYQSCSFKDTGFEPQGHSNLLFIKFAQICKFSFTLKSKCMSDLLSSPAALKYHSHLFMCPPRYLDQFTEKWEKS